MKNNEGVTAQNISFRWDQQKEKLIVTTQQEQIEVAAKAMNRYLVAAYVNLNPALPHIKCARLLCLRPEQHRQENILTDGLETTSTGSACIF